MLTVTQGKLLTKGKEHFERGDYIASWICLKKILYKVSHSDENYSRLCILLALLKHKLGEHDAAVEYIEQVWSEHRNCEYLKNAAEIYRVAGQIPKAVSSIAQALLINLGHDATVYMTAAAVYHDAKQYSRADEMAKKAIAFNKDGKNLYELYSTYGNTLYALWKTNEAKQSFYTAIGIDPHRNSAWSNLGSLYLREGDFDLALDAYMKALKADKTDAPANFGVGLIALCEGEYKRGLDLYEWRWRATGEENKERRMPWPRWDGEPCENLLIVAEQGFGDTFMMLRYLKLAQHQAKKVGFSCHKSLRKFMEHFFPDIVCLGSEFPIADWDYYARCMSLPRLFGTTLDMMPQPALSDWWLSHNCKIDHPLTVGYCYAGNPDQLDDRRRSIPQYEFMRIFDYTSASGWYLQSLNQGRGITFKDWFHTSQVLADCDLVISVDTGVAHLAATMGIPTWVLNFFPAYWPYGSRGESTPWYPTMRLFRQTEAKKWDNVIAQVKEALKTL